jgi:uncharacterized protein YjbI with pentapeptide repeats
MELPAPPRNAKEARFFAEQAPCEQCGGVGLVDTTPSYASGQYTGRCAHCGAVRSFAFPPVDRNVTPPLFHLGPEGEPSRLFGADQLRAIADRERAQVDDDPTSHLTMEGFRRARMHLERTRTALNELAKHAPDDAALAAEIRRTGELHAAYQAAEPLVDAKPGAHPKPSSIEDRFNAHRHWVKRGREGDGRLELRDEHWFDISASTKSFVAAIVEDSVFQRVSMSFGQFDDAVLRRVQFQACDLGSTSFDQAILLDCDLTGSRLSLAHLIGVKATGGDWHDIVAGRSTWSGRFVRLDLRGAGLRDSKLDDAAFEWCDLRGADLRRRDAYLDALGIARATRFVDCDLRGLRIEGWRLDGVVFERCRMHGIEGQPVLEGQVEVIEADLSADGEGGADAVGSARLAASWRGAEGG